MSWYYPRKKSRARPQGIKLRKASAAGDTWWSDAWMKALASFTKPRALERGHKYATNGQVVSVRIEQGFAEALVQGSRLQPYKVEIGLPMLTQAQTKRAADALMKKALYLAKLLAGEFPHEIAGLFEKAGAPLFPASNADVSYDCSCPGDDAPCQHITASYYILGQEFDRDPFLLLAMRGLNRAQLLADIQLRRATGKREAIDKSPKNPGLEFPAQTLLGSHLNDFFDAPSDKPLTWERPAGFMDQLPPSGGRIRELGSPPFWQSHHDFQDVLKAIYLAVRKKSLEK